MADLSITAASVKPSALVRNEYYDGTAGETITAGMPCYLSEVDGKLYKAIATSLGPSICVGISLHAALANQPLKLITKGRMNLGATVAAGVLNYVSDTAAGGIAPIADLSSGYYISVVGYGRAVSGDDSFEVAIINTRLALA